MINSNQIILSFELLLGLIDKLHIHIKQELTGLPAWIMEEETLTSEGNIQERIIKVWSHFNGDAAKSHQNTFACPGLLAANQETIYWAKEINKAKDGFKDLVNLFLKEKGTLDTKEIRRILALSGYPDIKLREVYRHIRCIDFHPRRISFSKVKHNSHRKISKDAALEKLKLLGDGEAIRIQEKLLHQRAPTEMAVHFDVQPIWAANISTFKNEEGRCTVQKILSSIPLIFLHNPELLMPEVILASKNNKHKSNARIDKLIEEEAFLPSLNAYLYKD